MDELKESGFGTENAGSSTNFPTSPDANGGCNGEMQEAGHALDRAKQGAADAADIVKEQLAVAGDKASTAATLATERAATGLHSAADMLRERAPESGAAPAVADRLDSAATAVQEMTGDQIVAGLEAMVRRNPIQTLLIAAAAGFLLARATR
jgi:hypothetical protein